ncbi:hypothetical protein Y1Q_0009988 [Alligator mississippiensis]|uniref:Uncharacterized protein n=1 Tax=Alligator mississippiensis TaxID=8496 RepID=A0A151ML51_ALLMI|nr:hypothetical protein Y1Q_0009988 [Alligator mississippiensis]
MKVLECHSHLLTLFSSSEMIPLSDSLMHHLGQIELAETASISLISKKSRLGELPNHQALPARCYIQTPLQGCPLMVTALTRASSGERTTNWDFLCPSSQQEIDEYKTKLNPWL